VFELSLEVFENFRVVLFVLLNNGILTKPEVSTKDFHFNTKFFTISDVHLIDFTSIYFDFFLILLRFLPAMLKLHGNILFNKIKRCHMSSDEVLLAIYTFIVNIIIES
jgi:hypothetical protein